MGSHTLHCAPAQHPVPRPPPARHPSSEKKTLSGFSAWYTMKMATDPCGMQSPCASTRRVKPARSSSSCDSGGGILHPV